ncbi:MAG: porin family protein [Bacteroidota bacterium]
MKNLNSKVISTIALFSIFFLSILKSEAQSAEIGLRFMPTFSSFDTQDGAGGTIKGEITLGYGAGAFVGFNFTEYIGIQGEIIYSSISQKHKDKSGIERKISLKYYNIPILFSLNTGKTKIINVNVVAGPQIGIKAGSNTTSTGGDGTASASAVLAVKKNDFGFAYGAGLDIALNEARTVRFGLGFRGVYGLFDISDNSSTLANDSYYLLDRTKIKTYSAYVGLSVLLISKKNKDDK